MFKTAKGNAYYLLTLVCVIYMFDYADRMVVASLAPFIQAEWNMSDADLGMLTGIVSLFIAIFVIPLSLIVDRWSRKKMIAIMVFVWSLATFLCAFASDYNQLLIFRAMTGLGEAAYAPAAVVLISKIFPSKYRARYTGVYNAFAPIGAGVGFAVGGYIGMIYGWRDAFGLVAIPGMILSVLMLFSKDYKTLPLSSDKKDLSAFKLTFISIVELLKIKTLWLVYFAYALIIGVNSSVMFWCPTYFIRYFDMDQKQAGTLTGGIALLVLIGAPLGGYLADRYNKKIKHGRVLICIISTLISAVALFGFLNSNNQMSAFIFLGLFGVCTVAFLAPATAIIQDVVQPGIRALAFGFNVFFVNLLGSFATPVIIGMVSDRVGLRDAMLFLPILAISAVILFVLVRNVYLSDKENVSVLLMRK